MIFMVMTPEVTWSGASLCPLGSCSGGYPEQLVICLPDFPRLMSQHEEQVSTGSMDCNRAPRLGGGLDVKDRIGSITDSSKPRVFWPFLPILAS